VTSPGIAWAALGWRARAMYQVLAQLAWPARRLRVRSAGLDGLAEALGDTAGDIAPHAEELLVGGWIALEGPIPTISLLGVHVLGPRLASCARCTPVLYSRRVAARGDR
jgi:hypothetical protein